VSTSITASPSTFATSPTQSRVVPGTSAVIDRSWAKSRLASDDLPEFGTPMIATRGG
jgi:hypothetical protein